MSAELADESVCPTWRRRFGLRTDAFDFRSSNELACPIEG
jgi:hypothetical protein